MKFDRQDENRINWGISHYLKGGLASLILDLCIHPLINMIFSDMIVHAVKGAFTAEHN
jgi:hypothetical protein